MKMKHPLFWPAVLLLVSGPLLAIAGFGIAVGAHLMKSGSPIAPETDAFASSLFTLGIGLFVVGIPTYFVQRMAFNSEKYPRKYLGRIHDQEKIAQICVFCDDPRFYHEALPLLTDDAIRLEYAKIASSKGRSGRAIGLLNCIQSPEVRYQVVMSVDLKSCENLLQEITDISLLQEISAKAADYKVKNSASKRVLSMTGEKSAQGAHPDAPSLSRNAKPKSGKRAVHPITPGRYKITGSGSITINHSDGSQSSYVVHNAANDFGYSPSEEVLINAGDTILNEYAVEWERLGN